MGIIELNWAKIVGNTISAFALTAIGINLAGAPDAVVGAFYVAIMTGLLAFAKEMQDEGRKEEEPFCESSLNKVLLL